jgi:protocatechuate 3,4-dioxygenase beta subunit
VQDSAFLLKNITMIFSVPLSRILLSLAIVLLGSLVSCKGQPASTQIQTNSQGKIGGSCEGCELIFVGMPAEIRAVDTSAGWTEKGQRLLIAGTIYQADGVSPAPGVILYYWQTDATGLYAPAAGQEQRTLPHGHIRGWVKTDEKGRYEIYTIRPGAYPREPMPAHVHFFLLEPGANEAYYTEDLNFDDDPLLIAHLKKYPPENRGGSGIARILLRDGIQVAEHDIRLGLNIPNHPKAARTESGLAVGEDQPSFIPFHAYGPDKGTRTCPVCKYGRYHGLLYFVGNRPNWQVIRSWLTFLERESAIRQQYLKVYFIYANEQDYSKAARERELENLGRELGIQRVALTFAPSVLDEKTELHLNKIDATTEGVFVIYRHRRIVARFENLPPTEENFALISSTLDKTRGNYFELQELPHN